MFDGRGDQVHRRSGLSLRPQRTPHDAEDRGVVGLAAAAGKYDFGGTGADQSGDGFACLFDGLPGPLTEVVRRAGVAKFGPEIRQHSLEHGGVHGRGGVMIQVDAPHWGFLRKPF